MRRGRQMAEFYPRISPKTIHFLSLCEAEFALVRSPPRTLPPPWALGANRLRKPQFKTLSPRLANCQSLGSPLSSGPISHKLDFRFSRTHFSSRIPESPPLAVYGRVRAANRSTPFLRAMGNAVRLFELCQLDSAAEFEATSSAPTWQAVAGPINIPTMSVKRRIGPWKPPHVPHGAFVSRGIEPQKEVTPIC